MDRIYFGIRMSLAMWAAVSEQSNPLTHENSNEVWMSQRVTCPKKSHRAWDPAAFISVV
jgi:hypothetical protein